MKASYVASPMSRRDISGYASLLRKTFGLEKEKFFPVVPFLEIGLSQIDSEFNYEIRDKASMVEEGLTFPEKHLIVLREDVYENAVNGVARDRFTVAHEIGHYLMHKPERIALARSNQSGKSIPAFRNPEWQANTFAAELLVPLLVIKGLSVNEIIVKCGVSRRVAEIQLDM